MLVYAQAAGKAQNAGKWVLFLPAGVGLKKCRVDKAQAYPPISMILLGSPLARLNPTYITSQILTVTTCKLPWQSLESTPFIQAGCG
jgi:hypothetical protein